jgi:demethoxyubiquinone hydroxylase (CLK1/Coq7/Cat5 family)
MRSSLAVARSALSAANLLAEVGQSEVLRAQARRARDPETAGLLRQILAHEATHACAARARVDAPEGVRKAAEAAVRLGGEVVGTVTSLAGERAVLAVDYVLERMVELGYRGSLLLLSSDARPSDRRVLKRALEDGLEHQALIRKRLGV